MTVGTLVRLKTAVLGNPIGTLGVCYEQYHLFGRNGFSFIFHNGSYDGFSDSEAVQFLTEVGFSPEVAAYQFTNVIKLCNDFQKGVFNSALTNQV